MASLSERDRRAWGGLCRTLAERIEPSLPRFVVGNRSVARGGRWRLADPWPALHRARRAAATLGRTAGTVLRTDVTGFYPSVTPSVLADALRAAGAEPPEAHGAADMVEGWGSEGYVGLPIGPPGSAVLANAVLLVADRALEGFRFLRWVDDYLIALPSEGAAAEALSRLDDALDLLGLRRSEPKTLLTSGAVPWLGGSARERSC
jgi:hypothetical protein